jgi:phosphopantothenoylcysteine decarboxylase/phosphopantothenate--cysteine ligase
VIPTQASLEFVGAAVWNALGGEAVASGVFDAGPGHIELARGADLVVIAPATANLMARLAAGMADDLLSATVLACSAPLLLFPAMHTQMWRAPATQANVATLRSRGVQVHEPGVGRLAGRDSGPGRMVEPDEISRIVLGELDALGAPGGRGEAGSIGEGAEGVGGLGRGVAYSQTAAGALGGRRVVVTAGGTREPIDPVRYLANRSSGRQGIAIAQAALAAGAEVLVIAANVELEAPAGAERVDVETAAELHKATLQAAGGADIVVMAAAVADFTPASPSEAKIPRGGREDLTLRLVATPDILGDLLARRAEGQLVVGFAAETGPTEADSLARGKAKARAKGADLTVVNDVSAGRGFGQPDNAVWILDRDGQQVAACAGSKRQVADAIVQALSARLPARERGESEQQNLHL